MKIKVMEAYRSQEDARVFVEMLKENRESKFATTESLYLANPRKSGRETDIFNDLLLSCIGLPRQ